MCCICSCHILHKLPFVQCIVNCAYVVALAWENEYTRKFALSIMRATELMKINCN